MLGKGNFEVIATGYKKFIGREQPVALSSIVSKHEHYAQAHHHLVNVVGAEKSGLGAKAVFTKGKLTFHINPIFKKKKNKEMKNPNNKKRIVKEAISRGINRLFEDSEKPDKIPGTDEKDKVIKGNKTLTGEAADKVNVEPHLVHVATPKGMKPNIDPTV